MRRFSESHIGQASALLIAFGLLNGCGTPAVVFLSPDYGSQSIKRVTVLGFADFPGQTGSGGTIADVFEKYLFKLNYQIVDPGQAQQTLQNQNINLANGLDAGSLAALNKAAQVDAVVTGSISELSDTSEETVMVDEPQLDTEPVYQDVVVQRRHGPRVVSQQTGVQTVVTDQTVPETETLPARVGLNVRMVGTKSGNVLWTGSASADGTDISSAAEAAASKVIDALQKDIARHAPSAG